MNITIKNPSKLPLIDITKCQSTQGDLKDLTKKNAEKLKNSIVRQGFIAPIAVWIDKKSNIYYLVDGHQRQRVFKLFNFEPRQVPYIEIPAKDINEAAEILLQISSQYGKITADGIQEFLYNYKLEDIDIIGSINFDALPSLDAMLDKPEDDYDDDDKEHIEFDATKGVVHISMSTKDYEKVKSDLDLLFETHNIRNHIKET